jgi:hypothetical protein
MDDLNMEEVNRQFEAVLKRRAKTRRLYAGYFDWDEQDLEEWGAVQCFVKSLKRAGETISDVRMYKAPTTILRQRLSEA